MDPQRTRRALKQPHNRYDNPNVTAVTTLHTNIALPVDPNTGINAAPNAPSRTGPDATHNNGTANKPATHHTDDTINTSDATTGTHTNTNHTRRVHTSPKRTANVIFPASESEGISRKLFTKFTAELIAPTDTAHNTPCQDTTPTCVNCVPNTATKPKNTNTDTSPNPRYPYGFLPPV